MELTRSEYDKKAKAIWDDVRKWADDNEIELSDDLLTLMVDVEMIKNYTVVNDRDNER